MFDVSDVLEFCPAVRELQLTQDMGSQVTVYASEFVPIKGDKTAFEWKDAIEKHRHEMPPYCLTNLEAVKENMQGYVRRSRDIYLYAALENTNDITWHTISMALRFVAIKKVNYSSMVHS